MVLLTSWERAARFSGNDMELLSSLLLPPELLEEELERCGPPSLLAACLPRDGSRRGPAKELGITFICRLLESKFACILGGLSRLRSEPVDVLRGYMYLESESLELKR